ncbi:hypothetical protein MIR68_007074 [Amoeboaphelidium protococcarum]|nr:hypothetical protein MIR68_007074 [Amoeboaphelidium protococcarum]
MKQIEIDLLKDVSRQNIENINDRELSIIDQFHCGKYQDVISKLNVDCVNISESISSLSNSDRLVVVACLIQLFVQDNFVGPVEDSDEDFDDHNLELDAQKYASDISGEDLLPKTRLLWYLTSSIDILNDIILSEHKVGASIWLLRSLFLLQRLCENPSEKLKTAMYDVIQSIGELAMEDSLDVYVLLQLLEINIYQYYGDNVKSGATLKSLKQQISFDYSVTGEFGRKMTLQRNDVALLKVNVNTLSIINGNDNTVNLSDEVQCLPHAINVDNEFLLQSVQWQSKNGDDNHIHLHPLEQAIILADCKQVQSSNPDEDISREQMWPYVYCVLGQKNCNIMYSQALLLRSQLESHKSKYVERALFQLQELVDHYGRFGDKGGEKAQYFHATTYPSIVELKRLFAQRLAGLGVFKSAMEIYESLHLWEDVVNCLVILEEDQKAEQLLVDLLSKQPDSPKLLCILGDIRKDSTLYQQAWQVSGGRYARAMRSLGGYYFKQGDYRTSIDCYNKALSINSLFESSWYALGCAALKIEDWDQAERGFRQCVQLNSENGEAWNNLAAIYSGTSRDADAFRCLKEGLKVKFDNWKMWQNLLHVGLPIGEYFDCIQAYERLIDLQWSKPNSLDIKILRALIKCIVKSLSTRDINQSALLTKTKSLLDLVTQKHPFNYEAWQIYTDFHASVNDEEKALQGKISEYKAINTSGVAERALYDEESFALLVKCALELAETYRLAQNNGYMQDGKSQARLMLKNILRRFRDTYEGSQLLSQIETALEQFTV